MKTPGEVHTEKTRYFTVNELFPSFIIQLQLASCFLNKFKKFVRRIVQVINLLFKKFIPDILPVILPVKMDLF